MSKVQTVATSQTEVVAQFTNAQVQAAVTAASTPIAKPLTKKERNAKRDNTTIKAPVFIPVETKKQLANAHTAATCAAAVGALLGAYTVEHDLAQEECISEIESLLRANMKLLQPEMFSRKHEVGMAFIDNINAARLAADKKELVMGSQYNYMSRTKSFIEARGAKPLDLFGNIAAEEQRLAKGLPKKPAAKKEVSFKASDVDKQEEQSDNVQFGELSGAPVLLKFVREWLAVNKSSPALEAFAKHVVDFEKHISAVAKANGVSN